MIQDHERDLAPIQGSNERSAPAGDRRPPSKAGYSDLLIAAVVGKAWKILARAFTGALAGQSANAAPRVPSKRDADRIVHPEQDTPSAERLGTLAVVCAFTIALAAGVWFVFAYWTGGPNLVLGVTLALFFGGMGVSMVLYSHRLVVERQAVEPRHEIPSSLAEREGAAEDFCSGVHDIRRRGLLSMIGWAAVVIPAAIVVSVLRSLGKPPSPSLFNTVWKSGQRLTKLDGGFVSLDALQQGTMMVVFPEDRIGDVRAQTLLIRVNEQRLQLPEGREDWAPEGYVAYSRVCTHAGCPVALFEATTNLLMCPCHQSTFNVLKGAIPNGGPAARPLPQLPLYADPSGNLRAGGGFTEPPGPGFWGI